MTRHLALATCSAYADGHPDDRVLVEALANRRIAGHAAVWDDPAMAWTQFDAVLLRTTWDYFQKPAAFLAWLARLEALGTAVLNPPAMLRWNADKRYLQDLAGAGVPGVPTQWADARDVPALLAGLAGRDVVVKPAVSGGAWHTVRGEAGSPALAAAVAAIPGELHCLVQPFVPEIVTEGEWSLLFFGGRYSHAVLKRPGDGDYRVQSQFGGSTHTLDPGPRLVAAATRALRAAEAAVGASAAYARVDGVRVDGQFLLMEIELIEPSLFLDGDAAAAARFADVLAAHLPARRAAAVAP